jgi:hypothetical protein
MLTGRSLRFEVAAGVLTGPLGRPPLRTIVSESSVVDVDELTRYVACFCKPLFRLMLAVVLRLCQEANEYATSCRLRSLGA